MPHSGGSRYEARVKTYSDDLHACILSQRRKKYKEELKMTFEEIKSSNKAMLTPADVADVLGCNPHSIRIQAQADPDKLGFNVSVIGTRTYIPRLPFIEFISQLKAVEK